jgi:hypothetical protein
LKTWTAQDWDKYRTELVCVYKLLIRKDARHFFLPSLEGDNDEQWKKAQRKNFDEQLRFKNREVDLQVKEQLAHDFRDVVLRIEVQKALSIIRDYVDGIGWRDTSNNNQENRQSELGAMYISCIEETMAFDEYPRVKEALLSLVDGEQHCLKTQSELMNCMKNNRILASHSLEELYLRVEMMIRDWDKNVLPKPMYDPDCHMMERKIDGSDSFIFQGVESMDESEDLEEDLDLGNSANQKSDDLNGKQKDKNLTTSDSTRSEDDASFATALDTQNDKNASLPSSGIVEDLVQKRKILSFNAKDPLESIVEVAEMAKTARLMNHHTRTPLKKMRVEVEDSESDSEAGSARKSSTDSKKKRITPTSTAKRKLLDESDDEDLWEDTQENLKTTQDRNKWTEEESNAVKDGYELYGKNWALIKKEFSKALKRRTNVQIKVRKQECVSFNEICFDEFFQLFLLWMSLFGIRINFVPWCIVVK